MGIKDFEQKLAIITDKKNKRVLWAFINNITISENKATLILSTCFEFSKNNWSFNKKQKLYDLKENEIEVEDFNHRDFLTALLKLKK